MDQIESNQVIAAAQVIYDQANQRLNSNVVHLHARGYGAYSTAMSNMKSKFEQAFLELVDELEDK